MIAFLTGRIVARGDGFAVIDVGGVGYRLSMSSNSLSALSAEGACCTVLTHLQVREDALSLYGFVDADERTAFEALVAVSGVGPKLAMAVLSGLTPDELRDAVATDDLAALSAVAGVGRKTAQRLLIELKDRVGAGEPAPPSRPARGDIASQARDALASMGFSAAEIGKAMRGYEGPDAAEALVKHALKRLGGPA